VIAAPDGIAGAPCDSFEMLQEGIPRLKNVTPTAVATTPKRAMAAIKSVLRGLLRPGLDDVADVPA
jgi:hypothetical protein